VLNVGVISDTHGLLRPEAVKALDGSDCILHAGDIGLPDIVRDLEKIAPVHAIRGNVDTDHWARSLPVTLSVQIGGVGFFLIHNRGELKKVPAGTKVVIFGHSHQPVIDDREKVLYFNPGSAGPRRFKLPVSVGRIRVDGAKVYPELIPLLP
jgi:uncharacterized protein